MKLLTIILLFLPIIASAKEIIRNKVLEVHCNYPEYALQDGIHKSKESFDLNFMIDVGNKKTFFKGNNGISEVTLVLTDDGTGFSFIEIAPNGSVMTTAIDKNMKSVHSRNSIIGGVLYPQQYYGTCK
ncbi:MAG: hypothetical protein U0T83_10310 [Bacteriovoracaceae bacterium]